MFKRIKVITLLITVLLALGAMQLISAGVFIGALNNDKQNFNVSQLSSQNVAEFTDAWISLNQARVTLNRGMLRLQGTMASEINGGQLKELVNTANRLLAESKEHYDKYYALPETPGLDEHLADRLEEQYGIYSATLAKMNALLAEGKLEEMFKQNAEQKQTAMQEVYREWRSAQTALATAGVQDNESDYQKIIWLLSAVMFFILAGVFMGVQLELDGTKLVVDTAADIRWQWIYIGTAVVFFFQLLRPIFQKTMKNVSGPKFILPAIDGSTVKQKLFLIALLVIAVAWPFMVSRGTVDIATLTMIYIILGLGLNVVVGLSGLLVLGYGGFYAIGAYTFALLNHYYGLGFWTCLPLAGLVSAAAGFLLGFPVLRLRGDYLAIVTLGFGEIVRILLLNNTEITGGPNGISQIPKPTLFGLEFSRSAREGGWDTFSNFFGVKYDPSDRVIFLYLVALLLVVLSLFVINRLLRMPLGRAWEALREDEIACRSLGLSPTRIKLTAFTISAAFAGFAGTLFAARQGFVSPESFTFAESAFVLAIVVLGGMGSQFAVILAAVLLVVSRELMRDFNEYSMLMLGALMVLMMIWRPQGLLPMTRPQLKLKNGQAKEGEQA